MKNYYVFINIHLVFPLFRNALTAIHSHLIEANKKGRIRDELRILTFIM